MTTADMAHTISTQDLAVGFWSDPFAPRESTARRGMRFALVTLAHVAMVAGVLELSTRPEIREAVQQVIVRLVETQPPKVEPVRKEAKPIPVTPRETVRQPEPPPILAAAADAPAMAAFTIAPQPPAPPVLPPVPASPPAPAAVTAARFDAEYLQNPKPVYPVFSRRQGEEGKVQLRVRVSADGAALDVEIKQSSGFPRLDSAARAAVLKWRFVPARRGDAAIESWVGVPIVFKLES